MFAAVVPVVGPLAGGPRPAEDPAVAWVRAVVAAVVADLDGTDAALGSGLHWAAALLSSGGRHELAVTSNDAGWIPPRARLPRGVRLLWDVPDNDRWAGVEDPVRPLLELAAAEDLEVLAIATTHPSRAHQPVVGAARFAVVEDPVAAPEGADRRSRFELTASAERVEHIRSLRGDAVHEQLAGLAVDALDQLRGASVVREVGAQVTRYLESLAEVPVWLVERLVRAREELVVADRAARRRTADFPLGGELPDLRSGVRRARLEADVAEVIVAAAGGDLETAVAAWTSARFRTFQLVEAGVGAR